MRKGFTLIELSIVLVIIGLLIGGILAGQSMISSAKINAQIKQLEQFDIVTNNFKQKYNQIPGDCSICPRVGGSTYGNNDGKFQSINSANVPPSSLWYEPYYFFIDLYKMGHINTLYQYDAGHYSYEKGEQFPPSAIGRGGLVITGNANGDIYYTFIYYSNIINQRTYTVLMDQGTFSASEAFALDTKLDDARPSSGKVAVVTNILASDGSTSWPFDLQTGSSSDCVYNNNYNLAIIDTNLCRMVIKANIN